MSLDLSIGRGDNAPGIVIGVPDAGPADVYRLVVAIPGTPIGTPTVTWTFDSAGNGIIFDPVAKTVTWPATTAQTAKLADSNLYTLRQISPVVRYLVKARLFGPDGPVAPSSAVVYVPGPVGPTGGQGAPGASAYVLAGGDAVWGSLAAWLASLKASGNGGATYTAAAAVSGDKPLMFAGNGQVVHADPTAPGYVYAGVALNGAQPGAMVQAIVLGDLTASFWTWTPGQPVFAAPVGALTQTPPVSGRSHLIGWATSAQSIHLDPDTAIPIM